MRGNMPLRVRKGKNAMGGWFGQVRLGLVWFDLVWFG